MVLDDKQQLAKIIQDCKKTCAQKKQNMNDKTA